MSDDFFSGQWTGEYWYSTDYPGLKERAPIPFVINMTLQDGVLKGDCVDDETKHFFVKPAIIDGTISNNTISFKKIYPHFWDHDENNKLRFLPKLPARLILYTGQFENGQFKGDWEVSSVFTDETGEIFEYRGRGFWQMKKAQ